MATRQSADPAMVRVLSYFKNSGLTLDQLGQKMGYPPESARKSVWQFMKSSDPRISMLRKFAVAAGIPIEQLIAEKKGRSK
jgi:transcriptional regulator with XRE-family HTH domain